jgi:3-oxoacyl-(acyl-carrier-protein) synthase
MERAFITGIGVISPIGNDLPSFSDSLFGLKCGIERHTYSQQGNEISAFTGEVDESSFIGRYSKEWYNSLVFSIEAISQALADAEIYLPAYKKIALCIGTSIGSKMSPPSLLLDFQDHIRLGDREHYKESNFSKTVSDFILAHFGFDASSFIIATACSASNNAALLGARLIQSGEYDLAIAGGSNEITHQGLAGFSTISGLNDAVPNQPYTTGSGISFGEGAGFVVIEPEGTAQGKAKYVELLTGGITSDGYHPTAPDPRGAHQRRVIEETLHSAGLEPDDIDYINGHGTGTLPNDRLEVSLYSALFPPSTLVSSTKSFFGHLLGAAGIMEMISTIVMMKAGKVVGTLNREEALAKAGNIPPNFIKNIVVDRRIDYALNISFAFGGNNSAVLLSNIDTAAAPKFSTIPEFCVIGRDAVRTVEAIKRLDPRTYMPLDNYSKLIANSIYGAITDAGLSLKDIKSKRNGIIFATYGGPESRMEKLKEETARSGYRKVSAQNFSSSTPGSIVGTMCKLFDIHHAASVLTVPRTYPIDAFEYAKYIANRETMDYLFVVFANEATEYSIFENDILFGDRNPLDIEDYAATLLIDVHGSSTGRFIISDPFQIKKHSGRGDDRSGGADGIYSLDEFIFDEISQGHYSVRQDYFEGGHSQFEVARIESA